MKPRELGLVGTLPVVAAVLVFSLVGEKNEPLQSVVAAAAPYVSEPFVEAFSDGWQVLVRSDGVWNRFESVQVEVDSEGNIVLLERESNRGDRYLRRQCGKLSAEEASFLGTRMESAYLYALDEGVIDTLRHDLAWSAHAMDTIEVRIEAVLIASGEVLALTLDASLPRSSLAWGDDAPPAYVVELRDELWKIYTESFRACSAVADA